MQIILRLSLIITTLFLTAYLIGCKNNDLSTDLSTVGACELTIQTNEYDKTKAKGTSENPNKSFCYEATYMNINACKTSAALLKGNIKNKIGTTYTVNVESVAYKFLPNAKCPTQDRTGTCTVESDEYKGVSTKQYTYKNSGHANLVYKSGGGSPGPVDDYIKSTMSQQGCIGTWTSTP